MNTSLPQLGREHSLVRIEAESRISHRPSADPDERVIRIQFRKDDPFRM
ncbi:MAG: hypothetical protein M3Y24_10355 [Acidobacteriota bacterium]|nr:hypothetical protein [Acidobacteriota bacterium]